MLTVSVARFDGDLTIVLGSGLRVRVPNTQFITPHVHMNPNGSRELDYDRLDLVINGLDTDLATLGRYFLTSAYLMVNHDAKAFTLWQANPTTSTSLVRVLDEASSKKCGRAHDIMSMSRTSAGSSRPSGAVVGGAVAGGIVAAALLGLGAFFLIRRKRATAGGERACPDGGSTTSQHKLGQYNPGGAAGPETWAQELPTPDTMTPEAYHSHQPIYEMDGDGPVHRASDAKW